MNPEDIYYRVSYADKVLELLPSLESQGGGRRSLVGVPDGTSSALVAKLAVDESSLGGLWFR